LVDSLTRKLEEFMRWQNENVTYQFGSTEGWSDDRSFLFFSSFYSFLLNCFLLASLLIKIITY
jgi:hypothetical protein